MWPIQRYFDLNISVAGNCYIVLLTCIIVVNIFLKEYLMRKSWQLYHMLYTHVNIANMASFSIAHVGSLFTFFTLLFNTRIVINI